MAEERVVLTAELADQMSAPLNKLESNVDGFTKTVEDGAKKQAKATEQATKATEDGAKKQSKSLGGLMGVFDKVAGSGSRLMSGLASSIQKAAPALHAKAQEIGGKLGTKMGEKIADGVKLGAAAVGGALVAGLALAVNNMNEQNLLETKLGLSPAETERVGKVSGALYASGVGEGLVDVNTALEASYKAFGRYGTMTEAELAKASTQALAVAKVLGVDVTRATQVAGTMVKNELARNSEEAFDLMITGSQNAAAGMGGDIMDTLDEYSTFFTSLGISGPEAMSLLSEASHGGVMALDKAADAVKEFGIRSTDLSKASTGAFEAIGMDGNVMANRLLAGGDAARSAFNETVTGLLGIEDPAQRASAAIALFGTPIEDMDVSMIPSFLESLLNMDKGLVDSAGAAQKAADTLNSGPGFAIEKFKREGLTSLSEFAAQAIPYVEPFFSFVRDAKDWLAPTAIGIGVLVGALAAVNAVLTITNAIINANPVVRMITLITAGVALLVGGLIWAYNNVGWFKDFVDGAMKLVGEIFQNVGKWITDVWTGVVDWWNTTLMPAIQAVGQWFGDTFTNIGNFLRDFIGFFVDGWGMLVDFWNGVLLPAIQAVAAFFAPVFEFIGRLVSNFIVIAVTLFQRLVSFWQTNVMPGLQMLGDFIGAIFGWIYNVLIKPYIDFIIGLFTNLVSFWQTVVMPGLQALGDFIGMVFAWIWNTLVKPYIDFIVAGFAALVDFWNVTVMPGLQALGDFIGSVMTWIYETLIKPVIDLIVGAFTVLTDWWNSTLAPMIDTVGKWFSETIGGAINGVKGFIDDNVKKWQILIDFFSKQLQPAADGIGKVFEWIGKVIGDASKAVGDFANNPLGGIQDMLGIKKDENGQGVIENSGGGVYTRFAGGGVAKGYAPGRDIIPALISPGESVLVPELTAAIGPQNIMAANAAASGGRKAGAGPALTSGFDGTSSRGGGGGTTVMISAPIQVSVYANENGEIDVEQVERIFAEMIEKMERRNY